MKRSVMNAYYLSRYIVDGTPVPQLWNDYLVTGRQFELIQKFIKEESHIIFWLLNKI